MTNGDMDAGAWSCGMVAGLINDIPTVKDLIDEIIFEENFEVTNPVPKPKLKREVNTHFDVDKTKTIWYIHYLLYPKLDNRKFLALFRRRFRMPYESFARLLITIKHEEAFFAD